MRKQICQRMMIVALIMTIALPTYADVSGHGYGPQGKTKNMGQKGKATEKVNDKSKGCSQENVLSSTGAGMKDETKVRCTGNQIISLVVLMLCSRKNQSDISIDKLRRGQ